MTVHAPKEPRTPRPWLWKFGAMPILGAVYTASCTHVSSSAPPGGNAVPAAVCVGVFMLGVLVFSLAMEEVAKS